MMATLTRHKRGVSLAPGVYPEPGLAYPLQARDSRLLVFQVPEGDLDGTVRLALHHLIVAMKPSSLSILAMASLVLDAGTRAVSCRAIWALRTRGQHISNWIRNGHISSSSYQLDFRTQELAGKAALRKQMRHSPNLRIKARGRPHCWQRFFCCTVCFAGRLAFAISDFLAMLIPS